MVELLQELVRDEDRFIPLLFASVFVVWIVFKGVTGVIMNAARERTKREIAAYIAEGSMTPEHGERLLASNGGRNRRSCWS